MTSTLLSLRIQRPRGTKTLSQNTERARGESWRLSPGCLPALRPQQRSLIGESGYRAMGLASPGCEHSPQPVYGKSVSHHRHSDCRPRAAFSLLLLKPSQCRPRPLPMETIKNKEHTPVCDITQPCKRMPENSCIFV